MTKQTKRPSLQELLRRQQQAEFVGRAEQLTFFRDNLGLSLEDPRRKFVINVFGQGGIGKTTLLGQFRRIAEEMGHGVALTDENEDDVPEVMGRWAAALKRQGFAFKEFDERYKVYCQKREELEADPQAPQGFMAFAARILTKGTLHTVRHIVPGSALLLDLVDNDEVATQASEWADFIRRRLRNKDEVRLVLEPEAVLTPLFLAGLQAEDKPALLLCDTYERTSLFLDEWLRRLLDGQYGDVPGDLLLIISGRDELERNAWAAYMGIIGRLSLESFSEQEARDFLAYKGITNEGVVDVILELSGLLPVLLATLAAESPNDPTQIGDVSGTAVERFLMWVDDPTRRALALNAALSRYFNKDIVRLLTEDNVDALFEWLKKMPFVKEQPGEGGWVYHDVVRKQMLLYKRRVSAKEWAELHGKLADYWRNTCEPLGLEQAEGMKDERCQQFILEALYHRLCEQPQQESISAKNGFVDALGLQQVFARRWAEVIEQAGRDMGAEVLEATGQQLKRGLRAYELKDYPIAILMSSTLIEETRADTKRQAILFAWRGEMHLKMEQYDSALADLSQTIELDPNYTRAFTSRGLTYLLMEQYESTLVDFTRAIELDPNYTWTSAMRGVTYLHMEQYERALADFSHALELDANVNWYFAGRGQAHRFLGEYEAALADFSRAIELDPNEAWPFALRGEIHWLIGEYEAALADFSRAIELDPNHTWAIAKRGMTYQLIEQYEAALADLSRAIELDPSYTWVIAARGIAYQQIGQYESALIDFNRAIELGLNYGWLIAARGGAYGGMERYDPALADFSLAIKLDPKDAWAFSRRGETYHLMEKYEPALEDFTRAIELDPNDAWAIANRGEVYRALKQYELALEDFNRVIELDASDWMYYRRGTIYQKLSQTTKAQADLSEAIRQAKEAYEEKPQDWQNALDLALYFLADEQTEKARQVYQNRLSGEASKETIQEAIDDLEDYLFLFPDHEAAQEIVVLLRKHLESDNGKRMVPDELSDYPY